jgi:F0F1-type ATP synthase membrane subunit b/b'
MNYEVIAFWSQIAGFVFFVAAFVWAWQKWLMPAIAKGQESSNERIALSERHRDEAKAAVALLQYEVEGAERDAEAIKARAAEQAKHDFDAIIAEAKEEGARTIKNAEGELDRARASARDAMRIELLEKALLRARDEAAKRVDAAENAKLVDAFIASLSEHDR